ncbi:hypothetical protein ERJ75_000192800 [Trypanosoma vivax]|uniref:Pre-rRNA-processing protein TSR2 n=1 Tax=Trypanosoma vivax (strain Y486) TaxID=1055687 RepID=G0UA48_TRYVY|nr:hypothetical protein TRVL_03578 [Trypanosoma vivax]KAH8619119.1 hypothetical protein ERJ75_000192800 [Trypanosoma vivax]CCC52680.1 conserved hypothetical protein [Trypanosoma vivax Y486]
MQQTPPGLQLIRQPYRATAEQFQRFVTGLDAVLNQWTALHLVAQHCDLLAISSMYRELVSWFEVDGEVYADDLEIFFENFFTEVRSVIVEDDSMKEVGEVLHDMYCRCCQNDFSTVERYVSTLDVYRRLNPVKLSVNVGGDEESAQLAENEEDGDGDAPSNSQGIANAQVGSESGNKRRRNNRKNAHERTADGWCVVRY